VNSDDRDRLLVRACRSCGISGLACTQRDERCCALCSHPTDAEAGELP